MSIRLATRDDLPRIVDIYNASIAGRLATADTEAVSVTSRERWFLDHAPGSRPLLVLEDPQHDREITGWVSLQSFYGRPAYQATAEVSVYVAPEHQGRGVGRRLLEEMVQRSPGLGVTTLLGFVFGHNTPSLRLFETHGFARWAHLPRVAVLDRVDRDLIILGRRLAP